MNVTGPVFSHSALMDNNLKNVNSINIDKYSDLTWSIIHSQSTLHDWPTSMQTMSEKSTLIMKADSTYQDVQSESFADMFLDSINVSAAYSKNDRSKYYKYRSGDLDFSSINNPPIYNQYSVDYFTINSTTAIENIRPITLINVNTERFNDLVKESVTVDVNKLKSILTKTDIDNTLCSVIEHNDKHIKHELKQLTKNKIQPVTNHRSDNLTINSTSNIILIKPNHKLIIEQIILQFLINIADVKNNTLYLYVRQISKLSCKYAGIKNKGYDY